MVDNPFAHNHTLSTLYLEDNYPLGSVYTIEHDGFEGEVIGYYQTREGKQGVVLQQIGTKVVHVYGTKWLAKTSI